MGNNKKWILIITGLLVLIVAIIGVIILSNKKENGISFMNNNIRMEVNEKRILDVIDSNGNEIKDNLTWTSSNSNIVIVDDAGIARAISKGNAIVSVKNKNGNKANCNIVVYSNEDKPVETIEPTPEISISPEPTIMLTPPVSANTYTLTYDANGGSVELESIIIEQGKPIGNLPIATRERYIFNGWYTAKKEGTKVKETDIFESDTTIYARWKKIAIESINIKNTTVQVNKSVKLKVEYVPTDATSRKIIEWKSENNNIATVDSNGVVKGIKAGTVKITATSNNGKQANCTVTVKAPSTSGDEINILVGDSRTSGICRYNAGNGTVCSNIDGHYQKNNNYFVCQGGMGYEWFNEHAIASTNEILNSNTGSDITFYLLLGINDLGNINKYKSKYLSLSKKEWKKTNIIIVSVFPVDETKGTHHKTNLAVEEFNNQLKLIKNDNISYCDLYSYILNNNINTNDDGIHYTKESYIKIYQRLMTGCKKNN